ncbi:MAG: hypothetical protein HY093_01325 [Candidatus Liptonbacteria bacterium]|nr:hypothetical protein [Candidatus Liptonbacteria bacterium]
MDHDFNYLHHDPHFPESSGGEWRFSRFDRGGRGRRPHPLPRRRFISNLKEKQYIEHSQSLIEFAKSLPGVEGVTARYLESGKVESDYKTNKKRPNDLDRSVGASIVGIDPKAEDAVTHISKNIIEGSYLDNGDYDQVVVGALLLKKYLKFDSTSFPTLDNIEIGSKVRVTVSGNTREVTVKGIIKSKVDEIDRRVFFVDQQFRGLINRYDFNVDEIVVRLKPQLNPLTIKNALASGGFSDYAKIQTAEDAEPKFLHDIKQTFALLGSVISSIGLIAAAITIFIIIFVNAITRRRFIGIMKGIGVTSTAVEFSYILQSLFYALFGTAIGMFLVFVVLVPYFHNHPINFPFSDGILVATLSGTLIRAFILFASTVIAGYIPARIVVKQNTLDAILGR